VRVGIWGDVVLTMVVYITHVHIQARLLADPVVIVWCAVVIVEASRCRVT
jgi:hypothetical protein